MSNPSIPQPQSPLSTVSVLPSSTPPLTTLTTALHTLYTFLTHLPHIPPSALVFPSLGSGWPEIPVQTLEEKHKTSDVLELLRHLPYLSSTDGKDGVKWGKGKWMLGPDTVSIDYASGEMWPEWIEQVQKVPDWCVWLATGQGRQGGWLLGDTRNGTLTHYTPLEDHLTIPYPDYESLPPADRWMAHPTMDATAFVKLWIRRFEKLIWMPVPVVCGKGKGKGKVEWFFTAETREEEEDLLTDDEEFEGGGDGEGDEDEEDEEGDEDEDGEGVEADVAGDEIDGLWEDAYGESEWRQRRNEVETQGNKDAGESVAGPSPDTQSAKERHLLDTSSWDAKTRGVYDIYALSGWPSNFDREKCEAMLKEFIQRER